MSLKELYRNKWARFGFWAVLYVLWVIWLGNYWWLFGLVPIFDHHITRKVKWLFWKKEYKEGEKHNVLLDWLDAIIFAVVVVTFINTFFSRLSRFLPHPWRVLSTPETTFCEQARVWPEDAADTADDTFYPQRDRTWRILLYAHTERLPQAQGLR